MRDDGNHLAVPDIFADAYVSFLAPCSARSPRLVQLEPETEAIGKGHQRASLPWTRRWSYRSSAWQDADLMSSTRAVLESCVLCINESCRVALPLLSCTCCLCCLVSFYDASGSRGKPIQHGRTSSASFQYTPPRLRCAESNVDAHKCQSLQWSPHRQLFICILLTFEWVFPRPSR